MSAGLAGFRALARRGNVIPVWRDIPGDCLTPVLCWLSLARRSKRSFLLESVEGGETLARYSFVGRDPWRCLTARGGRIRDEQGRAVVESDGDILGHLRQVFEGLMPAEAPDLPRFAGGAVGWIGYDAARRFEPAGFPRARAPRKDALPDAWFGFYDSVVAFDHLRQSLVLIALARAEQDGRRLSAQHADAVRRLDRLASDLARPLPRSARHRAAAPPAAAPPAAVRTSGADRAGYREMVRRARGHIGAGDIFQVVLSRRFERRLRGEPFDVYRSLRRLNPSPYMFYLRDGDLALTGASPEMMLRVVGGRAELNPIAGTRPRGRTRDEDAALAAELLADPKERAEHVMLVDLGRNDLGRVCAAASVRVEEFMQVRRFSHVMHLVSQVAGALAPGIDRFDALRAVFPAGTVSGAPKVRAMQIIDELEVAPRGPYAGAICYADHGGNLDSCIAIRTMVARGRRAIVQAGAGIVADSDPDREYDECGSKARVVLRAIEEASSWAR